MLEMYRTIFVWLANSYATDSTQSSKARDVLNRMESVISKEVVNIDYRQSYQLAMIYHLTGDKQKFDEYSRTAEEGALIDKKSSSSNAQGYYNPYRILLDIYEARGEYQKALNLINELDQRDPTVVQKRESIMMKMSGGMK
jgi:hypothetical protein